MIEIPAVIDKEDIVVLGSLKGLANDGHVTIDGTRHSVGRLVFRGFAGGLDIGDHMYHGVVRFDVCDSSDFSSGSFSPIVRAMEISESEVDDAVHRQAATD